MAEIKIEEKKGSNWIWWLLGLAVLAALLWWLLAGRDDGEPVVAGDTAAVVAPSADGPTVGAAATGAITDLAMLGTAATADMAGRQVMLTGVPVQEVVSDKGFWLGSESERVFVVRGDESSPATPPDGAVNAGQTVSIFGVVQSMPSDLTQQTAAWNLRSTDVSALAGQRVYVQADSIRITSP